MTGTNNSLNIPLTNGQLMIGSTGLSPVAAVPTAGTNMTIVPGPGTLTFSSTATSSTTVVVITSAPPGTVTVLPNTKYVVGNNGTPFNAAFILPGISSFSPGDEIMITTCGSTGTISLGTAAGPNPARIAFGSSTTLSAGVLSSPTPGQASYIKLQYAGIFAGNATFQVLEMNNVQLS